MVFIGQSVLRVVVMSCAECDLRLDQVLLDAHRCDDLRVLSSGDLPEPAGAAPVTVSPGSSYIAKFSGRHCGSRRLLQGNRIDPRPAI